MKSKAFSIVLILCFLFIPYLLWAQESGGITTFRIAIAGDQYYQKRSQDWKKDSSDEIAAIKSDDWKNDLADLIFRVNRKFEEQGIKVRFKITGILNWQTEDKIASIYECMDDLIKKIPLKDSDLIIGLTAGIFLEEEKKGGLYSPEKYILVKDYSLLAFKENKMVREHEHSWTLVILLHEIGHFFLGISHSDNPESIMHEAWPSGYKEDFLEEEIDLINKNASEIKKMKINAIK